MLRTKHMAMTNILYHLFGQAAEVAHVISLENVVFCVLQLSLPPHIAARLRGRKSTDSATFSHAPDSWYFSMSQK